VSTPTLQFKLLRRKSTPEEYRVYRAGLEWDLTDPIVIEKREDFKSEYLWRDRLEPYHHQVENLITFCRRLPVTLLADDVGLGKTISAGLVLSELIVRSRISKILVVCPKLLGPQWKEELDTKFGIEAEIAIGQKLIDAEPEEAGAIITTYQSARIHLDSIPRERFQMLVLDEAHKLRNLYGTDNPPQVALRFKKALEQRRFRYILMLTATPIHNRLWDLYSLVDLLTVARGHQNPFGSEGMFARKFIADNREEARHLKSEARDEFRSIVYSYMSRVRRGDAKLYFPDRVVQMHRVSPSPAELELIHAIAKPIQKLNRLAQISILQALTSSPDALMAQLNNMARNGTIPRELASTVVSIVTRMPTSAKLEGLGALIERLKGENPERWRLVVFTGRLETQTTIQAFLEKHGFKVGIINGSSGPRNQATIAGFRRNPPAHHIIVSTEAGSEGVNLQVANVLVNFDLPWNPMIVEQRIGRVQRLASEHASVGIFNIMLRGTFEEYIVGRLMEKLQMASHAIGDIEALLEASGVSGEDEDTFEEKIRKLVVAALAGKDIEAATRKAAQSIENAKETLKKEQETINSTLGGTEGAKYVGPRAPALPKVERSMSTRDFTLNAFRVLGAQIAPVTGQNLYLVEENGGREYIKFDNQSGDGFRASLYAAGTLSFLQLVGRIIATGIYDISDMDSDLSKNSDEVARDWIAGFGGVLQSSETTNVLRCFDGNAVLRVRATVAHDSYERLVTILCDSTVHRSSVGRSGLYPLTPTLDNPSSLGINPEHLLETAQHDPNISEFCRFYRERRSIETQAAGDDERKRRKLEDDFTPRLEMTLVALEGKLYRRLDVKMEYSFDDDSRYSSTLTLIPHRSQLINPPSLASCAKSGKNVPVSCLGQCQVSGQSVLKHFLVQSDISTRVALPESTVVCSLSGKRVLKDEAELSAVTGQMVATPFLKTSEISGKRAEPHEFDRCSFTKVEAFRSELATSDISGRQYRADQEMVSALSGKKGHSSEFVECHETRKPLSLIESEQCAVTGHRVMPGILQECSVSKKPVLPSQLEVSDVTGQKVARAFLKTSAISGKRAEPDQLGKCAFTNVDALNSELTTSDLSGKTYRADQEMVSTFSGKKGHSSEFLSCHETRQTIALLEAEQCEETGHKVRPGILIKCSESQKRVLPSELERCSASGNLVLRRLLVTSTVSGVRVYEGIALRSAAGRYCAPIEAKQCIWNGNKYHPDDLRDCFLSDLAIHFQFTTQDRKPRLKPLVDLLNGSKRTRDESGAWEAIATDLEGILKKGHCKIESAILSPDKQHLAVCSEVRTLLGLRLRHAGFLYSFKETAIVGGVALGHRTSDKWEEIRPSV
jgi:superfamily II DNA or RNA helicase